MVSPLLDAHVAAESAPVVAAMKGIGFVNTRSFVLARYGAAKLEAVLASMSDDDRRELESVVAVGWYSSYLFARFLRAIDRSCGAGDLKLLYSVGAYEAEHDFNRAVRLLMRVVSPEYVFKTHQRLWRHFQTTGEWTISSATKGVHGALTGWAVDQALCTELAGYLVRLLEFTGGVDVSVEHPQCRARGAEQCSFKFRWS